MGTKLTVVTPKLAVICLAYTLAANTIFSVFMAHLELYNQDFAATFIFTQCIGFSATLSFLATFYFFNPTNKFIQIVLIMSTMVFGSIVGSTLGSIIALDSSPITYFTEQKELFLQNLFYAVSIGTIAIYLYIFHERISEKEDQIREERFKRLSIEKKIVETKLKLLQAQIEPHFLFNTLSTILSLLDTDLNKGKQMMTDLINFLRSSLSKSKDKKPTVEQAMETIQSYLNIFKIRMGDRLQYGIHVPDDIKDLPFPPMLIQPLVENSIKHGIEPKIEGGKIIISAEKRDHMIIVQVADNGLGFESDHDWGFGLSNIQDRIEALYGEKGQLVLEENKPAGLKAIIEVPCETG